MGFGMDPARWNKLVEYLEVVIVGSRKEKIEGKVAWVEM